MSPICEACKDWGTPGNYKDGYIVRCSKCNRYYWPNLGVNIPAGSSCSIAATHAVLRLQRGMAYEEELRKQTGFVGASPKER